MPRQGNPSIPALNRLPGPVIKPKFIQSPHSPTQLRYPPSPHYQEWWGRCFRCTRKGHIAAECTQPNHAIIPPCLPNPATTSVQAQNRPISPPPPILPATLVPSMTNTSSVNPSAPSLQHNASSAAQRPLLQQPALPLRQQPALPLQQPAPLLRQQAVPTPKRTRVEPTFEEFLGDAEPTEDPPMPANRPRKLHCYYNRDKHYFDTLDKMLRGIVLHPPRTTAAALSLDQVAATIATSGMVTPNLLQVARLSHNRFLILIPPFLDKDQIVAAIPEKVWDDGFKFRTYSPLADTSISIPRFKLWIDITGVPLELNTEAHIARAVSSFGLYLGSMEPATPGDCCTWSVFIATDDLGLVPHELIFRIAGMTYNASVRPRRWIEGLIYQRADLPPPSVAYNPPAPLSTSSRPLPIPDPTWSDDDDVVPMSLTALREIFKDFASSELPPDLAECLGGNKAAIKANHDAYRQWELRDNERRIATHFANCDTTPATNDPGPHSVPASATTTPLNPCITPPTTLNQSSPPPLLTHGPTHARPHVPSPTVHRTDRRLTTVHRTTCPDLSLHLCPHSPPPAAIGQHATAWDSHVLFPEISAPTSHPAVLPTTSFPPRGTTPQATPIPTQPPSTTLHATPNTTNPPRRTARVRTTKSTPQDPPLVDLEARDFYDIPLQYAEGRELLELIGAASIQIPPHLLQPTPIATVQPQAYPSTLAQSSTPTTQAHPDKRLLTKNKKPKAMWASSSSTPTPLESPADPHDSQPHGPQMEIAPTDNTRPDSAHAQAPPT